MKKIIVIVLISLAICSCKTNQSLVETRNNNFTRELAELKDFFHIPAASVIIKDGDKIIYENYLGYANLNTEVLVDSSTTFPMASLTKIFSAVLIMMLVEEKKLNLDDPINKYISNQSLSDSIKVKHILSHTSQGDIGQHFYYSSRFGLLTSVIEKASGQSFKEAITEKIIMPLGLRNTYLLEDSLQLRKENRTIAMPYQYEGEVKDGYIDYGFSSAAGIASTVRDLAVFSSAMDADALITADSRNKMFTPFKDNLPYGQGIFSQKILNQDIVWGYGQYDCYSSVFLKVPGKNLTLIIAANNNLLSDPARLIYGDVSYSLFAISFLKNYVFDLTNEPLLEDENSLKKLENKITRLNSEFYRRKLLAQSISESFLAQYESSNKEMSIAILEKVFKIYPECEMYADLSLLHNLSFLKTIALLKEQKRFTKFDTELEKIGLKLLTIDKDNPYANYYLANYYSSNGSDDIALEFYEKIINARNFSRNWYTSGAENWIKEYHKKNLKKDNK